MSKRKRKEIARRNQSTRGIPFKKVSSEYLEEQRKIENRSNLLQGDPDFATFFQNERTIRTIDPDDFELHLAETNSLWCGPLTPRRARKVYGGKRKS